MTVVERGGASVAAVAERTISPEQRRGMVLLGSEISLFMVAFGLVGPLTFVPLFVSHLTDHPLAVGAVTAAFQLGWMPQLLVAGYVERSDRKWPWVQWFGGVERVPVLVLMLCALAAPSIGSPIVWVVYLACFAQSLCGRARDDAVDGRGGAGGAGLAARSVHGRVQHGGDAVRGGGGGAGGAVTGLAAVPVRVRGVLRAGVRRSSR